VLRAIVRESLWGGQRVFVHVFYNPFKAVGDRERLYRDVVGMFEQVKLVPQKFLNDRKVRRYISVEQVEGVYRVGIKSDVVVGVKRYSGWLVIVSNSVGDAVEVLRVYRCKDVVEKGFLKFKNSLDLACLRVYSDLAMQSKVFVCFIALVLLSYIHNVMADKKLYKLYTVRQLMWVLSKRCVQRVGEDIIEYPMTKEQRDIYSAFDF